MAIAGPLRRISSETVSFTFSYASPPVTTVSPPELVTVETRDAYNGAFDHDRDIHRYMQTKRPDQTNPVTGPIFVEGALPGDALSVTIEAIRLGPTGYVAATPGTGLLGSVGVEPEIITFQVIGNSLWLGDLVEMPLRPMVGTIGVAPPTGEISTLSLGSHGGNLDMNDITVGTTVHLPVWHAGGLFGLGDVHAAMGQGEVHSGVNISAEVDLRIELTKNAELAHIWFETDSAIMTIGVADEVASAIREAAAAMEIELMRRIEISATQARAMTGATVDFMLGQCGGFGVPVSAYAIVHKSTLSHR